MIYVDFIHIQSDFRNHLFKKDNWYLSFSKWHMFTFHTFNCYFMFYDKGDQIQLIYMSIFLTFFIEIHFLAYDQNKLCYWSIISLLKSLQNLSINLENVMCQLKLQCECNQVDNWVGNHVFTNRTMKIKLLWKSSSNNYQNDHPFISCRIKSIFKFH